MNASIHAETKELPVGADKHGLNQRDSVADCVAAKVADEFHGLKTS